MTQRISYSILTVALAALLSACLLDSDDSPKRGMGFVRMNLDLERNAGVLGKSASADTTFNLDSMYIELSAPGAVTQSYRYSIFGRPDTGAVTVDPYIFGLNGVRTWKARIYTIDNQASPDRRDTVHFDSTSFYVSPGDTVNVNAMVRAAVAILRVKLLSTNGAALLASVNYLRVRVNGVTQDSIVPAGATYNDVYIVYHPTNWLAWAVSDSGGIYKTADSGTTWSVQSSPSGENLNSVAFTSTTKGVIVGDNGTILRTTDGTTWGLRPSGTTKNLRQIVFATTAKVYAVGDGGVVLKSLDTGKTWTEISDGWFSQTSPPTHSSSTYNAVAFNSANILQGIAVGNGGVFAYTTTSGNTWTAFSSGANNLRAVHMVGTTGFLVGDAGTIIRTVNSTATAQTNSATLADLHGVDMTFDDTVWVVGQNETILKTLNGGTAWLHQTGGWYPLANTAGTTRINSLTMDTATSRTGWAVGAVAGGSALIRKTTDGGQTWTTPAGAPSKELHTVFTTNATRATAVGDSGTIVKTNYLGTTWGAKVSKTSYHLRDIDMVTASVGWAVGDSETVVRTNDSSTWTSMPGGFAAEPTGIKDTILGIHFFNGQVGWAVTDSGKTLRSADGGDSWTSVSSGVTTPFRGVSALSATHVVAVGNAGRMRRSTNSGTAWSNSTIASSTTDHLRALYFIPNANQAVAVGWAVGSAGSIRITVNGGANFSAKQTLTPATAQAFQGVHSNGTTYVWAVGDSGITYYRNALTAGTFIRAANAVSGSTVQLNGVFAMTDNVVVAVGKNGLIRRTTDGATSGGTWTTITAVSPAVPTEHLTNVWFSGTTGTNDTGYAFGENGVILESVNSGLTWTVRASGTGHDLKAAHVRPGFADSVLVGGENGYIGRSINGGLNWTGQADKRNFTGVDFIDVNTGWISSSDGRMLKTTNGGLRWVVQDAVAGNLNGLFAKDGSKIWAVGNSGMIRYSANGGGAWTTQTTTPATTANLKRVHFRSGSDTGWATGDGGVILRTTNGTDWVRQANAGTENLRGVWAHARDTVYAVGENGTLLRTITRGVLNSGKSTHQTLRAIFNTTDVIAVAVGDSGTILKTTNRGHTWAAKTSSTFKHLNAVNFPSAAIGYAAGAAGTILKTTDNGENWSSAGQNLGGFSGELKSLTFSSPTNGWATSTSGSILKTTDGANWVLQVDGQGSALNGVHAVNADSAFAVGVNGTILKTRKGGTDLTTANLRSTQFIGDTGFVVGQTGTTFKTFNGGGSWTALTGAAQTLNGVTFSKLASATGHVLAVGDGGTLVQAALSATSWTSQNSGTTQRLNSIHIAGAPRLYLVGDSGVVKTLLLQSNALPINNLDSFKLASTNTAESLRGVSCYPAQDTCLFVGTNESVVKTDDGASTTYVFKSSGARRFNNDLTYKALSTRRPNIILIQAIDRRSPLRGYQRADTLSLTPGQDMTLNVNLLPCGGTNPACTP